MMRILPVCRNLAALAIAGLSTMSGQATVPDLTVTENIQGGRDLSSRLTVPVTINGAGPYQFVVDTGAERTVISRELAERLTLAASGRVTLLSIAGTDVVDTATVAGLRLTASRSHMNDFEAPLLPELHLGAVGMLGIDSLQTKRVVMDFRKMRMAITESTSRMGRAETDEIVVTARRKLGQLILIDAETEGQAVNVILDTGSAVTVANPALRQRLAQRGRLGTTVPISITSVTGATTFAEYGRVRAIRLGSVTLNNMPIAFTDAQIFHRLGLDRKPALLLGMDALRMFDRVSIDFANRSVRFLMPGDALFAPPPRMAAVEPRRG